MLTSLSSLQRFDPQKLIAAESRLERELQKRQERTTLEGSLIDFVEAAWPSLDPAPYQPSWAIEALCEHLQAVTEGHISRLLVNFPPRCGKTNIASICYQAWTWARSEVSYLSGPRVKFLTGSYNDDLALLNALAHRRLVLSNWYQERWGQRFGITLDQNTKSKFDTTLGGTRLSTSARGSLLGLGGDIICIDDPHNTQQAESEKDRESTLKWWKELSTTRLNDPKRSAIVVIMQRLHEEDISGIILRGETPGDWVHLCIPMEYDWPRHCRTVLGWEDPRGIDDAGESLVLIGDDGERYPRDASARSMLDGQCQGSLMWPDRFGPPEVANIKAGLGPYMASGRLQQMPVPDKGGIFDRSWWQLYEARDGKFPPLDFVCASVDGAFTEKEENDPSAMTVWGCYMHEGKRRIILLNAWRKHLKFSSAKVEQHPNESPEAYRRRTMADWGLLEWINDTCRRFKADKLLIEAAGPGISAAQTLQDRYGNQPWGIQLVPVKGDKVARALAVQPTFAQLLVYAPARDWAEMVIDEMAVFPKGKHDDLTDSATQAMKYLRDVGLAQTDDEAHREERRAVEHKPRMKPIYPV